MDSFRADLLEVEHRRSLGRATRWVALGALGLGVIAAGLIGGWRYLFHDAPAAPTAEALLSVNRAPGVEFRDEAGRVLTIRGARHGEAVALDALPAHVPQAFLAVEDHRFFEHEGVDLRAIARAFGENLGAQRVVQGGSTITQQLVKTLYLKPDRTLKRKIQEARLAWAIERTTPKREILEIYLNRVFFGEQAYGIDAAARRYFGKRATALSLSEAALLAALPKAPSRLAPDENRVGAYERMRVVLIRMAEVGFITPAQRDAAILAPPPIRPPVVYAEGDLGWAFDAAARRVREAAPDAPGDLIVTLTIDTRLQAMAEAAVADALDREGEALRASQAALVALAPDGAVRALVGGRSYDQTKFNRATQARRQTGSAFKPFVYAAAFEMGLGPQTIRTDQAVRFAGWRPQNFSRGFAGPQTLETALAQSVNTIPVQLAAEAGIDRVIDVARRFGVTSRMQRNLATALGASGATLIEMTGAYGAIAAQGVQTPPYLLRAIQTSRGEVLFSRPEGAGGGPVYDRVKAQELIQAMRRAIEAGTARSARLAGWQAAGKTGTSQDYRDAWFIGFTPALTAGVWVGNDDFSPMRSVTGGGLPAGIWRRFMEEAHRGLVASPLPAPEVSGDGMTPEAFAAFYRGLEALFAEATSAEQREASVAGAGVATP
jgi:penicillin-binding protein 1A